jgi:hypothetical protein
MGELMFFKTRVLLNLARTNSISISPTGLLTNNPHQSRCVSLNFWSPGYKTNQKMVDKNGDERTKKIFVPTTTFTAAVAHMKNFYGAKEFLKYKDDIHPGHVALRTQRKYFSIGADEPMFENIGFTTEHKIIFSDSLREDVIGIRRVPDRVIELYTLNVETVEETISEFLHSKRIYSLLGSRLGFTEGESCATACSLCLYAGGLEELLRLDHKVLGKKGILTPVTLADYVKRAQNTEQDLFPQTVEFSKQFHLDLNKEFEKFKEEIRILEKNLHEENQPNSSNESDFKPN